MSGLTLIAFFAVFVISVSATNSGQYGSNFEEIMYNEFERITNRIQIIETDLDQEMEAVQGSVIDGLGKINNSFVSQYNNYAQKVSETSKNIDESMDRTMDSADAWHENMIVKIREAGEMLSQHAQDMEAEVNKKANDLSDGLASCQKELAGLIDEFDQEMRKKMETVKSMNVNIKTELSKPKNMTAINTALRNRNTKVADILRFTADVQHKLLSAIDQKKKTKEEQLNALQQFATQYEAKLKEAEDKLRQVFEQALVEIEEVPKKTTDDVSRNVSEASNNLKKELEDLHASFDMTTIRNNIEANIDTLNQMAKEYSTEMNEHIVHYQNLLNEGARKANIKV